MKNLNLKIAVTLVISFLMSCKSEGNDQELTPDYTPKNGGNEQKIIDSISIHSSDKKEVSDTLKIEKNNSISDEMKKSRAWETLVDIQSICASIRVEVKYAASDNFMKMRLYDTISRIYLQKDVAERLGKCQDFLKSLNKDYSLLVYDGVRPVSVQWKMWKALDSIPVRQRVKFVSNPANGSIHNYGAAVDLTICDKNGTPLDMGAGYDDIRQIAYPRMENHFLSTGELTQQQVENRKMLRRVMTSQNFRNISTEWWHFNACSRNTAKAKYLPLK